MEEFAIAIIILGFITLALWIYAIYDIFKGSLAGDPKRIMWLVIVLLLPILGVILYFLLGKD